MTFGNPVPVFTKKKGNVAVSWLRHAQGVKNGQLPFLTPWACLSQDTATFPFFLVKTGSGLPNGMPP